MQLVCAHVWKNVHRFNSFRQFKIMHIWVLVPFGEKMLLIIICSFLYFLRLDKQMPSVKRSVRQHSRTLQSRPRRPTAERGPYLEITDTQRKPSAQDHTCRTPLPPCTLGGRTHGP